MVLVDLHIGMLAHRLHQCPFDLAACDVFGVQDAAGAVSPLAGQVVLGSAGGEFDPPFDQVADRLGAFLDHHADNVLMADAGPGNQGVLHMGIKGVFGREHRGNTPLGVFCG